MATYKNHSWGRTRRPKSLTDDSLVSSKQTAITVTKVEAGNLADDLDSSDAGKNGYVTENQQYLHIQIENDDTAETLTIYAYNYAFGAWSILYIPVGGGTTAEATYVAASFTTIDGKKMVTVPIHGVDRVAFVCDSSVDANFIVRAACSTF